MKTSNRYYSQFRAAGYGAKDAMKNAKLLEWAREHDVDFVWEQDDTTNRDWTSEGPEYYTWRCLARILGDDPDGAWNHKTELYSASCGGIDCGCVRGTEKTIRGRVYAEARGYDTDIYRLDMEAQLTAEIKTEYERDVIAGLGNAVTA